MSERPLNLANLTGYALHVFARSSVNTKAGPSRPLLAVLQPLMMKTVLREVHMPPSEGTPRVSLPPASSGRPASVPVVKPAKLELHDWPSVWFQEKYDGLLVSADVGRYIRYNQDEGKNLVVAVYSADSSPDSLVRNSNNAVVGVTRLVRWV